MYTSVQCWLQIFVKTNNSKQLLDCFAVFSHTSNFFCFLESNSMTKISKKFIVSKNRLKVTGCCTHSDPYIVSWEGYKCSSPLLLSICHGSVQPVCCKAAPMETLNTPKYINGRLTQADRNGILGSCFIIKDNSQKSSNVSKCKTKKNYL